MTYLKETGRALKTRIADHRKALNNVDFQTPALTEHGSIQVTL